MLYRYLYHIIPQCPPTVNTEYCVIPYRAQLDDLFGAPYQAFLCMNVGQITDNSYYYYLEWSKYKIVSHTYTYTSSLLF